MLFNVLKQFRQALSIRKQVVHEKGSEIEVDDDKVESWAAAGFIDKLKGRIKDDEPEADDDNITGTATDTGNTGGQADNGDEVTDKTGEGESSGDDTDIEDAAALITNMDKNELEAFAKEKFGTDIDKRKGMPKLLAEVQELMKAK